MRQDRTEEGLWTAPDQAPPKTPIAFWVIAILLVGYVALCTGQRENKMGADAWEHLRDVRVLSLNLWKPGSPTFASDIPSVRYSPYTVGLAVLCRAMAADPYDVLSAAAVLNTGLLVLALWCLLVVFGEQGSAAAVLLVMVSLWGVAPGYANSYALSDLPWHEVNPSAFAFPLVLFSWALLRRMATYSSNSIQIAGLVLLCAISTLSHAMTGAFGIMGIFVVALCAPPARRRPCLMIALLVTIGAGVICLLWPWYSFLAAVMSPDVAHLFNPYILAAMLTVWCLPALVTTLFTIPMRHRPLVRMCLSGAAVSYLGGVSAFLVRSPILARFPMPAMIYLHITVGIFVHQTGILDARTWSNRIRHIFNSYSDRAAFALLQVTIAIALLFCLPPQLVRAVKEPYLLRPYLTRILHLRNLQQNVRGSYTDLLRPVGLKDVILSDPVTSWMIPAFRGRIVSAIHYELFVPDQPDREQSVQLFFNPDATEEEREIVIRKYNVSWIVLNDRMLSAQLIRSLIRTSAVVRQADGLVLMSASAWVRHTGN